MTKAGTTAACVSPRDRAFRLAQAGLLCSPARPLQSSSARSAPARARSHGVKGSKLPSPANVSFAAGAAAWDDPAPASPRWAALCRSSGGVGGCALRSPVACIRSHRGSAESHLDHQVTPRVREQRALQVRSDTKLYTLLYGGSAADPRPVPRRVRGAWSGLAARRVPRDRGDRR